MFYNTKGTKCNVSDDTKQLLNHLNSRLAELGRTEDILKEANDKEYQELLFDEFSL
ncbi:MAG: hypothetical protein IJX86_03845 [Lachnospiraceae bacterium]|nr:hypothetical protein [Lachnospiraceae bacterium]